MCSASLSHLEESDGAIRQSCSVCNWIFYPRSALSVSAVVVQEGNVLLVRRKHSPHVGTWMFPSGFLECGEHPAVGALRELYEETNISGTIGDLLGIHGIHDDPREPQQLAFFYEIINPTGEVVEDFSEVEEAKWFSIGNLPTIDIATHREISNNLYKLAKTSKI
jgi:ADP-ribose pyrophosphatase YjhB (NUDIX family)